MCDQGTMSPPEREQRQRSPDKLDLAWIPPVGRMGWSMSQRRWFEIMRVRGLAPRMILLVLGVHMYILSFGLKATYTRYFRKFISGGWLHQGHRPMPTADMCSIRAKGLPNPYIVTYPRMGLKLEVDNYAPDKRMLAY